MNIQNQPNINFKGFTNIVALNSGQIKNLHVSYISALLNNEGQNDLDLYHEIREKQGLLIDKNTDKAVTFTYVYDDFRNKETLFFMDKPMFWGDELKQLEERFVPKVMAKDAYKNEEQLHMKVYTLLASLSKRMSDYKFNNEDSNLKSVLEGLYKNLCKIIPSTDEAFILLRGGCMKQTPFQDVARKFNKAVIHTMKQFFV